MSSLSAGSDRLSVGRKLGYGLGDFSIQTAFNLASFYLLYYFTDVFMIEAAAAGMILMFGRLALGIFDPIVGGLSDRTSTRWGARRPYILFGAAPVGLTTFLLFASPDLTAGSRIWYALGTFILFFTAMSLVNIPYTSLTATLTRDTRERSSLAGYKVVFGILGTLFAAGATKPLAAWFPNEVAGFRAVGALYGLVVAAGLWITFASVQERVGAEAPPRLPFRTSAALVLSNRAFLTLAASTLLFNVAMNIMAALVNYYFKYNLGAENWIPAAFLALFITSALLIPFYVYLSNRFSKRFAYQFGMLIVCGSLVGIYFTGESEIIKTILLLVVCGAGLSAAFLCPWAMMPDTVEYGQWRTGLRREGIVFGCFFFTFKLSAALAGLLAGLGLDLVGYMPHAEQSLKALTGLRLMMSFIPLGLILAGMALLAFYPVDEPTYARITADIRAGRTGPNRGPGEPAGFPVERPSDLD
ncbi:MAG: MFS transporter [Proteobacteria bacterium]|nr:MFS transporter [Pseudomonadota bacterium]